MLIEYDQNQSELWDSSVTQTAQGTFLQTRRFLSYHRDRFSDCSLMFNDDKGRVRAVLPAAQALSDPELVISHPGLTFGGLLHNPGCHPDEISHYIHAAVVHYRVQGFKRFLYKCVPNHAKRVHVAVDEHAMWRAGGRLVRRDLWNVLPLMQARKLAKGHKWSLNKARRLGVTIKSCDSARYDGFHGMLAANLNERHSVSPVHSPEELRLIETLFPDNVQLWTAETADKNLVAGIWLFKYHNRVWHTQYIASNQEGRDTFALNLLIQSVIEGVSQAGAETLSFGASTEDHGKSINNGLFSFKSGFGPGSAVHDFIEVDL